MRSTVKSWTLASAPRAPDSSAFAQLSSTPLRSERLRADPLLRSVTHRCTKPARQAIPPGQRITGPSSGNARGLAGLRCGLGHALAPKASLVSGRAGQLVPAPLPPQPARPEASRSRPRAPRHEAKARQTPSPQRAETRRLAGRDREAPDHRVEPDEPVRPAGPAPARCWTCNPTREVGSRHVPRGVRAASFCSSGTGTKTAPPTQNWPHSLPPPTPAPPLTVRVPRWA